MIKEGSLFVEYLTSVFHVAAEATILEYTTQKLCIRRELSEGLSSRDDGLRCLDLRHLANTVQLGSGNESLYRGRSLEMLALLDSTVVNLSKARPCRQCGLPLQEPAASLA